MIPTPLDRSNCPHPSFNPKVLADMARMLLSTLAEHAIKEGSEVTVSQMKLEADEVGVVIGARPLMLTSDAARLIWVEINCPLPHVKSSAKPESLPHLKPPAGKVG